MCGRVVGYGGLVEIQVLCVDFVDVVDLYQFGCVVVFSVVYVWFVGVRGWVGVGCWWVVEYCVQGVLCFGQQVVQWCGLVEYGYGGMWWDGRFFDFFLVLVFC